MITVLQYRTKTGKGKFPVKFVLMSGKTYTCPDSYTGVMRYYNFVSLFSSDDGALIKEVAHFDLKDVKNIVFKKGEHK